MDGIKDFRWTSCNSIHSDCVLQCAESETLAVGSKGVALPCKFRNSATAGPVQIWLAILRNLPIICNNCKYFSEVRWWKVFTVIADDSGLTMCRVYRKGIPWVIPLSYFYDAGLPEVYLSIHIKPIARNILSETDAIVGDISTTLLHILRCCHLE